LHLGGQHGQAQSQDEKGSAQVAREFLEDVCCLGSEHLIRDSTAEGSPEPLLAGTLHEYDEDEKEADDDLNHCENSDQNGHKGAQYAGTRLIGKKF
jgi:hypothetical protein